MDSSQHHHIYYFIKKAPLIELEEFAEALRTEIIKRHLKPVEYELQALRKQIVSMQNVMEKQT
jgi:hypothetical protein